MEKQVKFLVEELHRGEWNPLMATDKNGEKKQKRVIITESQAEAMNKYSKEYKLRYIKADEQKLDEKEVDEKKELQKEYTAKTGKKPFAGWSVEQLKEKLK